MIKKTCQILRRNRFHNILDFEPWSAGKNVEWINAGLGKFKRGVTSRVIRKYRSCFSIENHWIHFEEMLIKLTWSITHGIKQANSCLSFSPKINGNDELTLDATIISGNDILTIQSLSLKPNIPMKIRLINLTDKSKLHYSPFTWLRVTLFRIGQIFRYKFGHRLLKLVNSVLFFWCVWPLKQ